MWAHYSEKQSGICLGFDVPRKYAEPIVYIDEPLADPMVDHRQAMKGLTNETFEAALRHKHGGWRYEKEWRVRVPLNKSTDGVHYKEFDDNLHLREVIIGPRCTLAPSDLLEAVTSPPLDVEISKARASFGTFDVCKHELFATHNVPGFRAILARLPAVYVSHLPDDDDFS